MKKLLFATNLIALGFIYFQSCTTSQNAMMNDQQTTLQNYKNSPFSGLSSNLIREMVVNYKSNPSYPMWNNGNADIDPDARSIWFNLDTLKKFIWYVETLSVNNKINNIDKLGVRLYYGRYPTTSTTSAFTELTNMPLNYTNRHTVFMLPTYFDGTYNVDFDPNLMEGGIPKSLSPILKNKENITLMAYRTFSTEPTNNMMQNHGDLIPPMSSPNYRGADVMKGADGY
jgi:hypothetical protein